MIALCDALVQAPHGAEAVETQIIAPLRAAMLARGVHFREAPRHESYGIVAVFEDRYGNLWDLIEPKGGLPTS